MVVADRDLGRCVPTPCRVLAVPDKARGSIEIRAARTTMPVRATLAVRRPQLRPAPNGQLRPSHPWRRAIVALEALPSDSRMIAREILEGNQRKLYRRAAPGMRNPVEIHGVPTHRKLRGKRRNRSETREARVRPDRKTDRRQVQPRVLLRQAGENRIRSIRRKTQELAARSVACSFRSLAFWEGDLQALPAQLPPLPGGAESAWRHAS